VKKTWFGLLVSVLLHAALYGGVRAYIAYETFHPQAVDIDLAGSSLIRKPHNAPQSLPANVAPPQPWILSNGRSAPVPKALTFTPQAQVEAVGVPCPAPCPSNSGDWLPASAVSERPQWMGSFSEDEYPRDAALAGTTGRVSVMVLVDAQGVVRDVQIIESNWPSMNELILRKLKETRFRPGYDQAGNAVPVRMKLPFQFVLY
jgi:TonB family protein